MKTILIALTSLAFVACSKQETDTADAASTKAYPLETCIVSGEKLGSMGDPIVINHEGQEIKFCCDACLPKFNEDPAKYLPKLDQ